MVSCLAEVGWMPAVHIGRGVFSLGCLWAGWLSIVPASLPSQLSLEAVAAISSMLRWQHCGQVFSSTQQVLGQMPHFGCRNSTSGRHNGYLPCLKLARDINALPPPYYTPLCICVHFLVLTKKTPCKSNTALSYMHFFFHWISTIDTINYSFYFLKSTGNYCVGWINAFTALTCTMWLLGEH